jgi:anti-sigma regulatory factor (Ser/Thr protein kinase)
VPPIIIPVDDITRVAEARRLAVESAELEGLGERSSGELAIITTEIATNILKHAKSGEIHITQLSGTAEPGVEILAIDRGPGMSNIQACVADGYSTSGTPGTGLGAISRLADVFDAYSQPGKGTVLVARKFRNGKIAAGSGYWDFAGVKTPYPGEQLCGDNWTVRRNGSRTAVIVADGLGHGILAAEASSAAIASFHKKGQIEAPAVMLENVHLALRSSRGAAVAVSLLEHGTGRVQYSGIGNIAGVLLGGPRTQFMVSHNGTAGLAARRFQEFDYVVPAEGSIVMHSDGLTTSWSIEPYPGLLRRHPAVIAGILYRDASRGRDDSCVVVGRWRQE